MAGEFRAGFEVGASIGEGIVERRRKRRFNEAYAAGDIQQAGLIDPDRLAEQQALQAQQKQIASQEDVLRRQATIRAATAAKNLAERTGDHLGAFDTVARISGKTFAPENLAEARALLEQQGPAAFDTLIQAASDPAEQGPSKRFLSTSAGIFDTETQQIVPGTGKEVDPLDAEYRRSQIDANRALAEQRRRPQPTGGSATGAQRGEAGKYLDREAGKRAAEWLGGDAAVTAANLARLDEAVGALQSGENLSGRDINVLPIQVRRIVSPKSAAIQQSVETAIQSSLKATLGAQFAKVEGENLLARAFDSAQDEAENARRVAIVAQQTRELAEARQAQAEHIQQFGSLAGYDGPDFDQMTERLVSTLRQFSADEKAVSEKAASAADDDIEALISKYAD